MAVLLVSSAPSRAAYDAIDSVLDLVGHRPGGMIVHAAAEQADGTVLIVDLWESETAMDAFEQGRLLPAFAAVPSVHMSEPPIRHDTFQVVKA